MQKPKLRSILARLADPLTVGTVALSNRVFLAPMSGVSDRPFREIAALMGAGAVVSEMIASNQLAGGDREALIRAERTGAGPHIVQLAGREAYWMAEGARAATDAGADIIDINMGCPAKKVTTGYAGAALMRDLDHALRLIDAVVGATPLPATLKMRLGWDDDSLCAPELARRAEGAGIRMVTVHGRTRCQFYQGAADWAAIRSVKEAVSIPVVANGDLVAADNLERMLELSGADAVMVGRGAYGRPWLPGQLAAFAATGVHPAAPLGTALCELVIGHYEAMIELYGTATGVRHARKHLAWYMDRATPLGNARDALRRAILTATDHRTTIQLLGTWFGEGEARSAA